MKVGLVYFKYPIYPGGSHITDFVESIAKNVEEVVLVSTHQPKVSFKIPPNLKVVWIPSFTSSYLNSLYFSTLGLLHMLASKDLRGVDVVNVICARGVVPTYIFSLVCRKKIFCTIELINNPTGTLIDKISYWFQKQMYTLPRFNKIICWSKFHYQKYLLPWGIIKDKVVYIPNGINTKQYTPGLSGSGIRDKYKRHRFLIVFAKPLYIYNKGSAELLVTSLTKVKNDIQLLIGGGPYKKDLACLIDALGLNDRVDFMPYVPMTDIPKYLAASDIVVLPYLYEATVSRSLLEAMSMGKAVITTNLGEPPLILRHGTDAIICEPTPLTLAKTIDVLLDDHGLRERLGRNARQKCTSNYDIEKVAQDTVKVYENYSHKS